jgi:CDP-diacylglycerol--serine O-phosphatidyltransferase
MGKIGWLVAFIYAVSGALRLARFNVHIGEVDKSYFEGLPSPAAAALLCSFVWVAVDHGFTGESLHFVTLVITLISGLLMVSKFNYYSFKTLPFKETVPFVWILLLVMVFVLLALAPAKVLFIVFSGYALSGIIITFYRINKARKLKSQRATKDEEQS